MITCSIKQQTSRPYLQELFVLITNDQGHQCLSLKVKTCAFPYQTWIWCQFTFISVLTFLETIMQHPRSIKSIWYLLHFDVVVPKDLLSPKHFGPGREEKRRDLVCHLDNLSCLCCPLLDITLPVEQMRERKWMPACALLMAKLSHL